VALSSSSFIHYLKSFSSGKSIEVTKQSSRVQDEFRDGAFVTPDVRRVNNHFGNRFNALTAGLSTEASCAQRSNIVTAKKVLQNNSSKSQWSGISTSESIVPVTSPTCASSRRTPIHITIEIHPENESSLKSKRLFESSLDRLDKKITLRELATIEGEPLSVSNRVLSVTCSINSTNATKLRFNRNDGLPLFIIGQNAAPKGEFVGSVGEIKNWLISQDFDSSLFCTKWISNHYRWIVWKLAAMERRFPQCLGRKYLTYQHVLAQLRTRYEKELKGARLPAVRKILNKDISATRMTILCVSQVLRFRSKQKDGKTHTEVRLELTDGWYSLQAVVDGFLLGLIEQRQIKVGSKLMVCNAQLVGSDDGVDPLDDCYDSSKRNCQVLLKINSNNTRPARWDAKLGFVSPKYNHHLGGTFLVKSLRDVIPDGGAIPAIDLVVCRKYPKLYLEHISDSNHNIVETLHLTEAEEAERLSEHEARHQLTSEKYAEEARTYCAKELDEDAPEEWKKMVASGSPEDFYQQLGENEKINVDSWEKKRTTLLHGMVLKSIQDSLKDDSPNQRSSVPYIRLLVRSFSHLEDLSLNEAHNLNTDEIPSVELLFWRVSEQVESLLKEGSVLRMKKLTAKRGRFDEITLTAGPETHVEPLHHAPTYQHILMSGYKKRVPTSLVSINIESKRICASRETRDFDVAACIVKVLRVSRNKSLAYLTDESGLVLKLFRDHKDHAVDPFSLGAAQTGPVVTAFLDVQISSFDTSEQCAVGDWTLLTCKTNRMMQIRCEELQTWCKSPQGIKFCCDVVNRIDSMIPLCIEPFIEKKVCVGYFLHLHEMQNRITGSEVSTLYMVLIDCGCGALLKAIITKKLLQDAVHFCYSLTKSILDEGGISLPLVSEFLRNNQVLFYFLLHDRQSYAGIPSMFEITQVSPANIDGILKMHSSIAN